jgi:hypothetical protein
MHKATVIRKASPNRFPIRLAQYGNGVETVFCVEELDPDGDWDGDAEPFDSLSEAAAFFDHRVKELSATPNWEAQVEYDDANGTVNGYAPWQFRNEY